MKNITVLKMAIYSFEVLFLSISDFEETSIRFMAMNSKGFIKSNGLILLKSVQTCIRVLNAI